MRRIHMIRMIMLAMPILMMASCTSYKKFLYFQTKTKEMEMTDGDITNQIQIRIQPDDMLAVAVRSLDPNASAPFNLISESAQQLSASNPSAITDYLVDADGYIDFPGLGRVQLGGFTIDEARIKLLDLLSPYLKDPIVNIRFTNFKITVLGQVVRPSAYQILGEKLTVTEALGMAGDITDYGDRSDVLVIREQDGKRQFGHLNMLDANVFNSEYYYLRQNDIVYVAPTKGKAQAAKFQPLGQIILPILGLLVSFTSLIVTLSR